MFCADSPKSIPYTQSSGMAGTATETILKGEIPMQYDAAEFIANLINSSTESQVHSLQYSKTCAFIIFIMTCTSSSLKYIFMSSLHCRQYFYYQKSLTIQSKYLKWNVSLDPVPQFFVY